MDKYQAIILLPLTGADGQNPVGLPWMTFPQDPMLTQGERTTLCRMRDRGSIALDVLCVNRVEAVYGNTRVISYVFEIADRNVALDLAQAIKRDNPGIFQDDNA